MSAVEQRREELGGGVFALVNDSFSFGTDTLLLADFAMRCVPRAKRAADLGTGCGVIPLLWAHSRPALQIDALELQQEGAALASCAVKGNGFADRVTVHCGDMRAPILPAGAFDLVACNPPYFRAGAGYASPTEERQLARAEESLTLAELCSAAARLLHTGGQFCLCHRTERMASVMHALCSADLMPKKLQFVRTSLKREPKLFLLCAAKGGGEGLTLLEEKRVGV